jgi:anthranilate synthase/aminodeoxychorismate synthase-like glutamine amidotransferase
MVMPGGKDEGRLRQSFTLAQDPTGYPVPGLSDLRIVVVDNYDSFTYNLVQYLAEISGTEVKVFRNDAISVAGIRRECPTHLVVSPGPCTPAEAGVSVEAIRALAGECPILGVCLGHQAIGQAYGGKVIRGEAPVHGKTSLIHHDRRGVFTGLPQPFVATRYHSLVLDRVLPPVLECSAWTQDGVIMGVRHKELAVEGVQFHPESLLTAVGKDLLRNFLTQRGPKR